MEFTLNCGLTSNQYFHNNFSFASQKHETSHDGAVFRYPILLYNFALCFAFKQSSSVVFASKQIVAFLSSLIKQYEWAKKKADDYVKCGKQWNY